jgi:hypothetical protein
VPTIDAALRGFAERSGLKLGQVAQPLRAALTGSTVSPGGAGARGVAGADRRGVGLRSISRLTDAPWWLRFSPPSAGPLRGAGSAAPAGRGSPPARAGPDVEDGEAGLHRRRQSRGRHAGQLVIRQPPSQAG